MSVEYHFIKEELIVDNRLIEQLKTIVGEEFVRTYEPMSKHCTFRCGGNASCYVIPGNIDELVKVVEQCRNADVPYLVIGNGSNLLVRDEGYDGVIIEVNSRISEVDVIGDQIVAEAGAKLSTIALAAMENDLAGFEFAHGIPGNIGGAVVMNAGAYGGEMKDVLVWVKVLDRDGNVKTLQADELDLGYRTSRIAKEGMIVLCACIKLDLGNMGDIGMMMDILLQKRRSKQPLEYPSAGSTFKRPEGYFAGKLIEDAGLRGYRVGGAMVSEKHCGFVINYENATATEIIQLMEDVKAKVKEQFDVVLEPEVKII